MLKIQIIGTYPATPPQVVPICPHPPGVQRCAGDARRAERSRGSSAHRWVAGYNYIRKGPANFCWSGPRRTAATYSPTWWGSTIGASELNFSVRNGKRWILTAITTAVYYLRENIFGISEILHQLHTEPAYPPISTKPPSSLPLREEFRTNSQRKERFRAISTGQLNTLPHLHFLPINVVVSNVP